MNRHYEYGHVVEFEETDAAGQVYDVNYKRWQAQCQEMFLLEHAPSVLDEFNRGLRLVIVSSECERVADVVPGEELSIRMRREDISRTRITFSFHHVRVAAGETRLVARGSHVVVCVRGGGAAGYVPVPVPDQLRLALTGFSARKPKLTGSVRLGTGARA